MDDLEKLKLKKFKIKNLEPDATILLYGKRRSGKCLCENTEILMYDGTIKKVQDIKIGDLVMGDDSSFRKVLSVNNGIDKMYEIKNTRGDSYIVNSDHILSLRYMENKKLLDQTDINAYKVCWFNKDTMNYDYKTFKYYDILDKKYIFIKVKEFYDNIVDDRYIDIPLKEYLLLSKEIKQKLYGYQVSIDFKEQNVNFDPYIIGLLLNNMETCKLDVLNNKNPKIIKYLKDNLGQYKCYLKYEKIDGMFKYRITGNGVNNNNNNFLNYIKKLDNCIPYEYKCNSRENRLKILGGFIDANGCILDDNKYEITIKNNDLANDIVYISKSLGFVCKKERIKDFYKMNFHNWKIIISGKCVDNVDDVNDENSLECVIKIKELSEDKYYGFELDGNHKFVLGNFIVTHNSFLARDIFYHHKNIPLGLIFSGTEEANPFFGDFIPDTFIHPEYKSDLVKSLMMRQSKKVKDAKQNGFQSTNGKNPSNRTFIVLDDMLADSSSWKKEKTIREIFFNGRHYNIFFILTMQYPVGIPPELRSNIDYVFIFNEPSVKNRKKLFDEYGGALIPTFDAFCNILDSCTQNHECLVIKMSGNSVALNQQIFFYKAEPHDNFRVGHPRIWEYHDANYNKLYDQERDLEQENIDKLKKKFGKSHKLKVIVSKHGNIIDEQIESE